MILNLSLPRFVRAHNEWHPKAYVRNDAIELRCAGAVFTVPKTGDIKADSKAAEKAVREYAQAHGWVEV